MERRPLPLHTCMQAIISHQCSPTFIESGRRSGIQHIIILVFMTQHTYQDLGRPSIVLACDVVVIIVNIWLCVFSSSISLPLPISHDIVQFLNISMHGPIMHIQHCMELFVFQYSFIQIDYSLSRFDENEDAYHVMPLLSYSTIAVSNFLEWIGVKHFTALQEDHIEFHEAPLLKLSHLVSTCTLNIHTPVYYSM